MVAPHSLQSNCAYRPGSVSKRSMTCLTRSRLHGPTNYLRIVMPPSYPRFLISLTGTVAGR